MTTTMRVARALSLIPTTRMIVTSSTMMAAGMLAIPPSGSPWRVCRPSGSSMPVQFQQIVEVAGPADGDGDEGTPYSNIRFQPVSQARKSPSVAYE